MPALAKPVVLLILDGWGVAPPGDGNPIAAANTPVMDELISTFPTVTVRASGEAVGLYWGEMGNSEVGHLTIGAGKVFYQTFPRINVALQNGEYYRNEAFIDACNHVKEKKSTLHVMGILSCGNIHGSDEHMKALIKLAKQQGVQDLVIHPILDGRDTIYNTGVDFLSAIMDLMKAEGLGHVGSIAGRYYTMDRDSRWDRVEKAYNAMLGKGEKTAEDPIAAVRAAYEASNFDEEFVPVTIVSGGQPVGAIKDHDAVIFTNYRSDRARQITQAFTIPSFDKFSRQPIADLHFVAMAEYEKGTPAIVAFPPENISACLAKAASDAGLKQLHIAETEKYAHVTFFLNGRIEEEFPGEDRVIIPSPRVSSYDQAPAMSTPKIAERIVKEVQNDKYDLIIANFANADMVGHTGNFDATKAGCEIIDKAIGDICNAVLPRGGVVVITADHGNGEEVINLQTGKIDKEHSTNPVPFIVIGERWRGQAAPSGEMIGNDLSLLPPVGMLSDTAPTILKILGVPQPPEMTGTPLI